MSDEGQSVDTSASSSELKAGHAPATKVGGMRVSAPRPRHTSHGEEKTTDTAQESSGDNADDTTPKEQQDETTADEEASGTVANRAAGQMVGGTFVPIKDAFPTEAVKHIHDKPGTQPKHDFHQHAKNEDQRFINQPRRQ